MKGLVILIEKKQKKNFFLNNPITKSQKPKSKQNVIFRASPILNIFSRKFLGLVLGCVGSIYKVVRLSDVSSKTA